MPHIAPPGVRSSIVTWSPAALPLALKLPIEQPCLWQIQPLPEMSLFDDTASERSEVPKPV